MTKRPLAVIAVFFIMGIVLAASSPNSVRFVHIFIATLIFIAISFVCPKRQTVSNIFLFLSIMSIGVLLYVNSNIFPKNHISHFLGEEKLNTGIVGVIRSPALTRRPYFGKINSTYLFEIEGVKSEGQWLGVTGLAQIRIQTEKDYRYGDRLIVKGTMRNPKWFGSAHHRSNHPELAEGQIRNSKSQKTHFNYGEYLERQNIFALINTRENNVIILSHDYNSNPIMRYIYSLREKLKNQIIEKMPIDAGAFLRAILLGDRSELPKHIQRSFKNSGTMHILAISGLHIALISIVIINLLKILRIKREVSYIFTMLFLILVALIALSMPSVVRAVTMACIFLTGLIIGRRADVYNSLGAAAIFILIKNPKDLFNVGFQLSFLAVFSILYLVPRAMGLIKNDMNFYVKRYFFTPLLVSISAWLGTAPLIFYYFKIITPVAIIANLFIIPALFASLLAGMAFLLLGWVPFLETPFVALSNILIHTLFSLADFFASLKFSHFTML